VDNDQAHTRLHLFRTPYKCNHPRIATLVNRRRGGRLQFRGEDAKSSTRCSPVYTKHGRNWRLASRIASSAFVGVTGDLRRDLFRHLTAHSPSYFAERLPGTLTSRVTATSNAVFTGENMFVWNVLPPCVATVAAIALVMSASRAKELGLKPKARFVSFATGGVPPEIMGIGPVVAIPKALALGGLKLEDIGVIELNEAFAVQSLSVMRATGLDPDKVNPSGGAIALGHPLGCTGAKLTATILREMERGNANYGMVTMCVGGGQGAAGILENLN